jgi:hypothetical protein
MEKTPRRRIRYLRTRDGMQLAWAEVGAGPVVVKAANWLTHLEDDLERGQQGLAHEGCGRQFPFR